MLFATHLFIGLLLYVLLVLTTPASFAFSSIAAFFLGVVAPDLDHPKSKPGRVVKPVSVLINMLFGHRGITHSIFGALLFSFAFGYLIQFANLSNSLVYWFFAGFLAHLIGDSLTPSGVKWFYPISKKRFRSFIRTGSMMETVFLGFVISALILIGWNQFI